LVRNQAVDLKTAAKEKRESVYARVQTLQEIIEKDASDDHYVIWHHLEYEREMIEGWAEFNGLDSFHSVYGSQADEVKEKLLIDFARGEYRFLATKPEIAGQGCNFQRHCHKAVFLGIDYKFNDFIQAVHRIQRFQQPSPCEVHILYTDGEENIRKELEAKWQRHHELVSE
ncbi:DNA methylase N-4, partial [Siphonobacter sp. BAB-5385]|uniref:hypothetical protein n=1 Tax=Siphonobacter sp. BAB-5385 TaxID=1864822 RepID=UPI000BDB9EF9